LIVAGLAIYAWKAKMVADSERDAKEIARAGEAAQKDRALIGSHGLSLHCQDSKAMQATL